VTYVNLGYVWIDGAERNEADGIRWNGVERKEMEQTFHSVVWVLLI
jgi:hypothetical protein